MVFMTMVFMTMVFMTMKNGLHDHAYGLYGPPPGVKPRPVPINLVHGPGSMVLKTMRHICHAYG
jgi:hypothetical protein